MEALLDQKESQLLSITRERGIRNDPDDEEHVLELHHLRCQKKLDWVQGFKIWHGHGHVGHGGDGHKDKDTDREKYKVLQRPNYIF